MEAELVLDSEFPFFVPSDLLHASRRRVRFFCFRRLASEPEVRPLRIAAERAAGVFFVTVGRGSHCRAGSRRLALSSDGEGAAGWRWRGLKGDKPLGAPVEAVDVT